MLHRISKFTAVISILHTHTHILSQVRRYQHRSSFFLPRRLSHVELRDRVARESPGHRIYRISPGTSPATGAALTFEILDGCFCSLHNILVQRGIKREEEEEEEV